MPLYAIFLRIGGGLWESQTTCTPDPMRRAFRLVEAPSHREALDRRIQEGPTTTGTFRVIDWDTGEIRTFAIRLPTPEPIVTEVDN